ncbi:MAG: hypothetical protein AAGB27_16125 [Pseudomonadota bacterium]
MRVHVWDNRQVMVGRRAWLLLLILLGAGGLNAQDAFENDNSPSLAREIADLQQRTFEPTGDEDWMYFPGNDSSIIIQYEFKVLSTAATVPTDFQAVVEVFPSSRLADDQVAPLVTIGTCQPGGPREPVGDVSVGRNLVLLRVRNCVPVAAPRAYEVTFAVDQLFSFVGGVQIVGTVTDSSSAGVGVFLLTDSNDATAANPSDGSYRVFIPANSANRISVVSTEFTAAPVLLDPFPEFDIQTVDFTVERVVEIFSDGFE